MTTAAKPAVRPDRAHFSSGPCAKRPGWSPDNLKLESLGRSHRSKLGKARLKLAIDKTRAILAPFREETWAIGLRHGDDDLRRRVNEFLEAFRAAGGFERLGDEFLAEEKAFFKAEGLPFYF